MERLRLIANHLAAGNFFDNLEQAPPDAIFGLKQEFNADKANVKVDLIIGAYRTEKGAPYVFESVRTAEMSIANNHKLNKEYLGMTGNPDFLKHSRALLFGADSPAIKDGRVVSAQTISGTGSLRVIAEFLRTSLGDRDMYIPNPTWANHMAVFKKAPFSNIKKYRYYDDKNITLDLNGMLADLNNASEGSIVLLHTCAHNPTGVDPTHDQWKQIAEVVEKRNLFVFFDSAYQGFATGDLEKDAFSLRLFVERGIQLAVSQSFAKNMGLYGERIGACHFHVRDPKTAKIVESQLKSVIRAMVSNCPLHGSRIVAIILGDAQLRQQWVQELKAVSGRIIEMRQQLRGHLERLNTPGNWEHITKQIGMFSFTGLSKAQCQVLKTKYHVYILGNGRMSMAGLNQGNVEFVAKGMKAAIEEAS